MAGDAGVSADRVFGAPVQIALDAKPKGQPDRFKLRDRDGSKLGEAEIAQAEGDIRFGIKLGQKPGAKPHRVEEFDDRIEVDFIIGPSDRVLGVEIGDQFLAYGFCE